MTTEQLLDSPYPTLAAASLVIISDHFNHPIVRKAMTLDDIVVRKAIRIVFYALLEPCCSDEDSDAVPRLQGETILGESIPGGISGIDDNDECLFKRALGYIQGDLRIISFRPTNMCSPRVLVPPPDPLMLIDA